MEYQVRRQDGSTVGPVFNELGQATALLEANDGYSKGWYVAPISESYDTTIRPQFLTEG